MHSHQIAPASYILCSACLGLYALYSGKGLH